MAEVFGYRTLNYPGNLDLVGNDTNAELTDEDAVFFNTIYYYRDFDFKGKKIAFMNPHLEEKQVIRTKKEYIEKIVSNYQQHLDEALICPYLKAFFYILYFIFTLTYFIVNLRY